jgi:hypothetical protein
VVWLNFPPPPVYKDGNRKDRGEMGVRYGGMVRRAVSLADCDLLASRIGILFGLLETLGLFGD